MVAVHVGEAGGEGRLHGLQPPGVVPLRLGHLPAYPEPLPDDPQERHEAQSEPGRGSLFTLSFPAAASKPFSLTAST